MTDAPHLLADLGGTHCRFALMTGGKIDRTLVFRVANYPSLEAAAEDYLAGQTDLPRPKEAAICVASPVTGDQVRLTNSPWAFSIAGLEAALQLDRLAVINDFEAVAHALPALAPTDRRQVGGGRAEEGRPLAVLGPGTGLGVSGLIPNATGWTALSGEGGHVTMSATDAREDAVIDHLRQRFGHVSAERVLSGMGLTNLYESLAWIDGIDPVGRDPAAVTEAAIGRADPHCEEALAMFCGMLGTVAGNLALTVGARGGVYIAGGIVPKLGGLFDTSPFRDRFEAKGRFAPYLKDIPTYVITHELPAFIGLEAVLNQSKSF